MPQAPSTVRGISRLLGPVSNLDLWCRYDLHSDFREEGPGSVKRSPLGAHPV